MTTTQAVAYSSNKKLWANMTHNDAKAGGEKIVIEFTKADKNNNGKISLDELQAYDKDIRNGKIKKGLLIGAGIIVGAIAAFAIAKGIKMKNTTNMTNLDDALGAKTKEAFADIVPDNFKGKGVSYLVNAEEAATPAYKLKVGKTVKETLDLNKEVGLELVQDATGKHKFGIKNPWTGWENLPGWKNEYGSLDFQQLKKMYPEITADMYFCPAGEGMIKAYGGKMGKNGAVEIQKAFNGVADIAFQANSSQGAKGAKNLVDITHVLDDGSAIKFNELPEGWNMVKKGQFNSANPAQPKPLIQTVVGFSKERTANTLEGAIKTDFAMTDGGGFPYNKFKDFWKQLTRRKVQVNPNDPNSVKMFQHLENWEQLNNQVQALEAAGKTDGIVALKNQMDEIQQLIKKLVTDATQI